MSFILKANKNNNNNNKNHNKCVCQHPPKKAVSPNIKVCEVSLDASADIPPPLSSGAGREDADSAPVYLKCCRLYKAPN